MFLNLRIGWSIAALRSAFAGFGGQLSAARWAIGCNACILVRELTKTFETIRHATLGELEKWVATDPNQRRGEFVVLVDGAPKSESAGPSAEACRIATLLADELPVKQAASLAASISGEKKNVLYKFLLAQEA